ncbi:MAG: purine-nucleoside phosphorylase [Erysipelotrichaceae bacterium]|nr:purine-nucleoside phosphorylase [Erysipelotrichaceae bacterium]
MSTPHNQANKGDIAKTVLMPGDPLRAKFLAETYLENVVQFNSVRNMLGYTGEYKGKKVSIMGSGMGMPSIGIYSHELYTQYDVENIIRIGSCGSLKENVHMRDIIIAQGACTDSSFASQYNLGGTFSAISSYDLLEKAVARAKEKNINYHVGNVLASDYFYMAEGGSNLKWAKAGCLGVEMESYALFTTAAYLNKKALTLLTVSDSLVTCEETTADEREKTFTAMMEIALEVAINED